MEMLREIARRRRVAKGTDAGQLVAQGLTHGLDEAVVPARFHARHRLAQEHEAGRRVGRGGVRKKGRVPASRPALRGPPIDERREEVATDHVWAFAVVMVRSRSPCRARDAALARDEGVHLRCLRCVVQRSPHRGAARFSKVEEDEWHSCDGTSWRASGWTASRARCTSASKRAISVAARIGTSQSSQPRRAA